MRGMGLLVHCFDSTDLFTGALDAHAGTSNVWFPCAHEGAWCEGLRDRLSATLVNADLPHMYGDAGFILSPEATPLFCSYSADGGTTDKTCHYISNRNVSSAGGEEGGNGNDGGVGGVDLSLNDWSGDDGCAGAWCSQHTCGDERCSACEACAPGYKAPPQVPTYLWPDRDWAPVGCLPGCGRAGSGEPNWCDVPLTAEARSRGCAFKAVDTGLMLRNQKAQNSQNYNEVVVDAEGWAGGLPYSIEAFFFRQGARPEAEAIARRLHGRFHREFETLLGPGAVPLLRFDPTKHHGALEYAGPRAHDRP
jgi:hypothetical protein